jgi:hypothetical protein
MKCYIYLDGASTSLQSNADNSDSPIILTPDIGTSNQFTFDISSYIDGLDTLSSDIQTKGTATGFIGRDTNSIKEIQCTFQELNLSSGLLVNGDVGTTLDPVTPLATNTFYCINGVWQYDEVTGNYDELNSFKIDTTGDKYFLTNNRNIRKTGINDSEYLSGFTTYSGSNFVRVRTYTSSNGSGSAQQTLFCPITINANRFDIPCGVANLLAFSSWVNDFTIGETLIIDSTINSYKIDLIHLGTLYSETVTFSIDHSCSDNYTRIKFLNRLGAFEYFTFKGYRNRSINVRKNYYQSILDDGYSIGSGGDRALNIDSRSQFEVYSQPLKEADRIWLEEMLEGMECFVEEGSNYIPIKVRAGGTKIIDEGNDLFTFKMTYEYANPNRRQNG